MQIYRFQWVDDGGRMVRSLELKLRDDVSALDTATERSKEYSIDIWQAGRHVAHVKKGNAQLDEHDRASL